MDEPAGSTAVSPAKGRGGPGRRGVSKAVAKRNMRKPALRRRGRGKGRGRNKTYDDPRTQASYERQKELRDLFSEVTASYKVGLEELADRNLRRLNDHPAAHQQVAEYHVAQKELDDRLAATLAAAGSARDKKLAMAERKHRLDTAFANKSFMVKASDPPRSLSRPTRANSAARMRSTTEPKCTTTASSTEPPFSPSSDGRVLPLM